MNILPGVQTRYSGGGTTVGQLLVTDALGKPFPALMRTLVLDPLEMANSTYEQPLPRDSAVAAATAHPWKGRPLAGRWHVYPEMAAAGLWTTASDLARAGIEIQRALRGKGTILHQATAQTMLTPSPTDDKVTLGFFLEGEDSDLRFGHGGWDEGFVARIAFYRDGGQGAVVMVNSNQGAPLINEIVRSIALEYSWPGFFPEDTLATPSSEILDTYVGTYAADAFECNIDRNGDRLTLQLADQPTLELRPTAENAFQAVVVNTEVVFNKTDGVVKSLTLKQGDRPTTAQRK